MSKFEQLSRVVYETILNLIFCVIVANFSIFFFKEIYSVNVHYAGIKSFLPEQKGILTLRCK